MTMITDLPHQRFTEAMNSSVYDETLAFHAKGMYALAPGLMERAFLTTLRDDHLAALIKKDVAFSPGLNSEIPFVRSSEPDGDPLRRQASAVRFTDQEKIEYLVAENLLSLALCADASGRRPYPSGGALYSVEAYLCRTSEACVNWPENSHVLRLRPMSSAVEVITTKYRSGPLLRALSGFDTNLGSPHFAIVYAIHIDRALFKYRYRGYRFAMMEVGAMFQICGLYGKRLGLRNRVWGGFHDYLVGKALGTSSAHLLPSAVQFFGKGDS
jgi:SagB-type dehydrogenase family enzyme